ncbi:hypothetical protein APHAL10511_003011 [Amanita phalloides]|nr:hypothetical protein APHAL10511_003011 [Amanita phalloides]
MRSGYSLIVPLVCALAVASQTFTIKSAAEEGHFIHTEAKPGSDVKLGKHAGTVFIDPLPVKVGGIAKASIMDTHRSLYVGPYRDAVEPGTRLVWSYTEYKWHIKLTRDHKYVIYHHGPHATLGWHDKNTDIVLEPEAKKAHSEWEIHHKAVVDRAEIKEL